MAKGGGAWKVAYADFVTAMMALFMVLWIMSQDTEILTATSRYFQNPFNSPLERSTGLLDDGDQAVIQKETDMQVMTSAINLGLLHDVAQEFYRMLDLDASEKDQQPVKIIVDDEGIHVTVFSDPDHRFFLPGSSEFTEWGTLLVRNLSWLLESYQLQVRIRSHTAKYPNTNDSEEGHVDAFDLSVERAMATRRSLVYYALPDSRIVELSGYGDAQPLPDYPPEDVRNERLEISLKLQ